MEKIKRNDFVEIEFTGKIKDGEIFDTNIKEDAEKININPKEIKPLIVCVGQEMLIKGFDKALEGKEIAKTYEIELEQNEAFGPRKGELIKLMPKKIFTKKNLDPRPGMTLALDTTLVRIASVSGGRVLVDFNNPLAGKTLIYNFKIVREVKDIKERIFVIIDFFLKGQKIDFEIKDKIIFKAQEFYKPLIEELNKRFKDVLGKEIVLEVVKMDPSKPPTPSQ